MKTEPPAHVGRDMTNLSRAELDAVARCMAGADEAPAGPLEATLITGGRSNLTYSLSDGASLWILRTPPRAGRTPSAHDVAREFRVTSGLRGSGVPVARPVVLCEDESVLGGAFTVVEYVDGRSIQSRDDLAGLDDSQLARAMASLTETLAALHRVDHVAAGLERFGRPDAYAQRQLYRWRGQWDLVAPEDEEIRASAAELERRLTAAVPEQRFTGIVHGDFRIDNTILRHGHLPEVAAVVDWELSTIGDPVADVAMMCAYRDEALDLILGAPSAWTSDRLPDAPSLAAAYEAAGGVALDHWDFHLALAYYKIGTIAAGIEHRRRAGVGTGPGFATAGRAVPRLMAAGLAVGSLRT
ncbi:phosphotransferase family protein [Streptomyces brasiliensis]|uniref:Acyl-CoA dehydrogenase n=1 Tax=Streptomyces brasiliensis TaxID=1954 RepID=A0A917P055_9ACTN|nr:phosphotransferase family protein [Streptomyces brasiliensis]GGJ41346.1 acyl-CoA dehydrogenase [Streptomyces brasiliensis]